MPELVSRLTGLEVTGAAGLGFRRGTSALRQADVDRHDHRAQPEDRDQHDDLQHDDRDDQIDRHGIGLGPQPLGDAAGPENDAWGEGSWVTLELGVALQGQ